MKEIKKRQEIAEDERNRLRTEIKGHVGTDLEKLTHKEIDKKYLLPKDKLIEKSDGKFLIILLLLVLLFRGN